MTNYKAVYDNEYAHYIYKPKNRKDAQNQALKFGKANNKILTKLVKV